MNLHLKLMPLLKFLKVRNRFFFILVLFISFSVISQDTDEKLANHYYLNGECEKALSYFEITFEKNPSHLVFTRYLDCIRKLGSDKEVIKLIEQQVKNHPADYNYKVMLGVEYDNQGDEKNASKTFSTLIDEMQPISRDIINIQKAFSKLGKYELALEALQKGRKIIKGNYPLNIQFAEVYGELGRTEAMIDEYVDLLEYSTGMMSSLQRIMPRMIDFENEDSEAYQLLKNSLIKRIQKKPNERTYADLLIWSFVQRKNYGAALIQAKGLDKRTTQDGKEVFNIGKMAQKSKDYEVARKAFKYVVDLGSNQPYYYVAEQLLLNTRFLEITTQRNYTKAELDEAIGEYEATLERVGKNGKSISIILELAHILAFYGDQSDAAKNLLEDALNYPRTTDIQRAEVKTLLADVLVLMNDIWEASLFYMQVEKDFKYEPVGYEAKFKNARIFYYDGDFVWSQSQLNILKGSTSKLIANDAMKLSIFITENLGLDSNYRAMQKFARADLLIAQHKYEKAFLTFDSIQKTFPFHSLVDEILLRKAQAVKQQGEWDQAIEYYNEILESHGDDIHGDDALFQLATIYERNKNDLEKAKEYYFRLLKEYPGSLFVTEARKRFRNLQDMI